MSESSEASGTTGPEGGGPIHSVRPPWCICAPDFFARGEIDPACRHSDMQEQEEHIRALHAQLDMVLRWHAGLTPPATTAGSSPTMKS